MAKFTFDSNQITTLIGALELVRMEYNRFLVDAKKKGQERIAQQFARQAMDTAILIDQFELALKPHTNPNSQKNGVTEMIKVESRRRVWSDGNIVFLRDDDFMGAEVIRQFWVPPSGGYVRELEDGKLGTQNPQACRHLATNGIALHCHPSNLLAVIRAEYRKRVAAERREEK